MKLVTYIENRFQECTLESRESTEYDLVNDAELKALHQVLNTYRLVIRYLLIPVIFTRWLLVLVGLRKAPLPVLMNIMKADKEAAEKPTQQVNKRTGKLTPVSDTQTTAQTPA